MKFTREAAIKEYFFGDAKRTLSPFTQSVSFDDLAIFRAPDGTMHCFLADDCHTLTVQQNLTTTTTSKHSSPPRSRLRCPTGRSR